MAHNKIGSFKEMVNITKNDNGALKKSLTKTNNISKANTINKDNTW